MAIALSIGMSLVIGVGFMFSTQYFWGKESNPNIASINSTMTSITNVTGTIGSVVLILVVVAVLAVVVFGLTCRGF